MMIKNDDSRKTKFPDNGQNNSPRTFADSYRTSHEC